MQPVGYLHPRRLGTATVLVAVLVAAVTTLHAQAFESTTATAALVNSSACQFTQLSVSVGNGTPFQQYPTPTGPSTPLNVASSGMCSGPAGTRPFTMDGTIGTVGAPSCASMLAIEGQGLLSIDGYIYPVTFQMGGPTASLQLAMVIADSTLTGGTGFAQLGITPASLQA
jgi:hypothetical protein